MPRIRSKRCDECRVEAETLYRVRHTAAGDWVFVCLTCQQRVSSDNPHYVYGGTWKARKRD